MEEINKWIFLLSVFFMFQAAGCTEERFISLEEQVDREYRIAVVLPLEGGLEEHWKKSVDWALDNINKQLISQRHIKINAEWYDEEVFETEELFAGLAEREDLCAVIGPLYSINAQIAAQQCTRTGKPLLAMASSELLMRAFAKKDFLWCLTENDISQCELLLTLAARKGAKNVALLTCDNIYGQTFLDWFAFQAKEMKLNIKDTETYKEDDLKEKMENMLGQDSTDCIICIPSDNRIALRMNELRRSYPDTAPFLLFSDVAFLLEPDNTLEGMEGIVQSPDPESGFSTAYEIKYGTSPEYGSAQFYDAIFLAALGILDADLNGEEQINSALKRIVGGKGESVNVCSDEAIARIVSSLIKGQYLQISGASGKLRFDNTIYTNVLHSIYSHQTVYEGKYITLGYLTSDESRRTSSSSVNWNWKVSLFQDFKDTSSIHYPKRNGIYAVIIASSSGWENYRHQADALALYRILKQKNIPDEHIILIMEDDLAFHFQNPIPGKIRITPEGSNVYRQGIVDYKPSGLSFDDLPDILYNKETSFAPDSLDNVLVFWIGHGEPAGLKWLDKTIPAKRIAEIFKDMAAERHYRKLLFLIEACYAGKVGEACEKTSGLLCITAATADETSKVSNYSYQLRTWLSNSFSDALLEYLASSPTNIVDLYQKTYNKTIGSHVSVYNAEYFGNLYSTAVNEFLIP